jgi:hypothetical protein
VTRLLANLRALWAEAMHTLGEFQYRRRLP